MEQVSPNQNDPDMMGATAALIRASKMAKLLAARTGTKYLVIRDGVRVCEVPRLEDCELPDPPASSKASPLND